MDIQEQREGAVTVIRPIGPVLLGEADLFRTRLSDAMTRSLGRLVVDASQIAYVDSKGLQAFVGAGEELAESGSCLRLAGANETLREVFELTETAGLFEHFADVHTAVRSFLS